MFNESSLYQQHLLPLLEICDAAPGFKVTRAEYIVRIHLYSLVDVNNI